MLRSLFALAALVVPAAGQESRALEDGSVELFAETAWPESLTRGFRPIPIRLQNYSDRPQVVTVMAESNGWRRASHRVEVPIRLEPGQTFRHELVVPAFLDEGWLNLELQRGMESAYIGLSVGDSSGLAVDPVLLLRDGDNSTARIEGWVEALQEHELAAHGTQRVYDVSLAALSSDRAPGRFLSYTSLSAVVVDTDTVALSDVPSAALSWARSGGTLALLGPDAARIARSSPELAGWVEDRFRLEEIPGEAYAFGNGTLVLGESLFGASECTAVQRALDRNRREGFGRLRVDTLEEPVVPGLPEVPYRAFILFLIAFFVVVGPINFQLVRRSRRPAWLLVTIPLLAVGASVLALGYGIFSQGIDTREAEHSVTVLDQRDHRAASVERRFFFAGLAPGDGLRPGPSTAIFPAGKGARRREALYLAQDAGSLVLSGEFLPVRRTAEQVLVSERAARGRLRFTRTDDGRLRCENALGAELEALVLRDEAGRLHVWSEEQSSLPVGDAVELTALEEEDLEEVLQSWGIDLGDEGETAESATPEERDDARLAVTVPVVEEPEVPAVAPEPELRLREACYLARLRTNPFLDDAGLFPDRVVGEHFVYGVLSTNPKEWE